MAQFISPKGISGKALPLRVAASMFRNLAAPAEGSVSQVLEKSPNADETNARRLVATLSNILASCAREASEGACEALFHLTKIGKTSPATTLQAAVSMARNPANNLVDLFHLGDVTQPYQPALLPSQGPEAVEEFTRLDAFTLAVKVNATGAKNAQGEELCPFGGPGNLVFDPKGYAWITNNVVQGQAGSSSCFYVLKPDGSPSDGANGTPVSPLSGGGVLGQGFGITRDPSGNIWAGNFGWGGVYPTGSVSKFSPKGEPLSPSSGYVSTLDRVQGTTSDQSGNIWMASYYGDSVHVFPKGNPFTRYPVFQDENTNPFHIVIDDKGAGWVSYTGTSALSKFTLTKRGLVKQFTVPIGTAANPKGIAVDSTGNVWATAGGESKVYAYDTDGHLLGGFSGGGITGPWGLSSDSKGNIWVANLAPANSSISSTG
jgi:sugar lactone lactonase YvrE